MGGNPFQATRPGPRFAEPPWNAHSVPWRQSDAQLPPDHLAREIRQAMPRLDFTELYGSYAGRGKRPQRPALMLALVLFALRQGQRTPSQWVPDTHEHWARWWLGYGIRPSRSCWDEVRKRTATFVDAMNAHILPQAVAEALTRVERGALDGSAVAANASRRRLLNAERLQPRLHHRQAARHDDAHGETPPEVPAWMAKTPRSRAAQHERYRQAQEHLAGLQAAPQHSHPLERRAPDKLVISTGAPAAALGMDKAQVFRPLYTIATGRDVAAPFIMSDDVFAQAPAAATLSPMLARMEQRTGHRLQAVLVDSG